MWDRDDTQLHPLSVLLQKEAQAWNGCRSSLMDRKPSPKRLRLCQDNEAIAPQQAIYLGIGILSFYFDKQVGACLESPVTSESCSPSCHFLVRLGMIVQTAHTMSSGGQLPPCDTAPSLSGCTPGSLNAFLAVEYWRVRLRRNAHHFLGMWNLPAQSTMLETCLPLTPAKTPPAALRNRSISLASLEHNSACPTVFEFV